MVAVLLQAVVVAVLLLVLVLVVVVVVRMAHKREREASRATNKRWHHGALVVVGGKEMRRADLVRHDVLRRDVGGFARVHANVLLQHESIRELLVTNRTLVQNAQRRLYPVYTHVGLEVALRRESAAADLALEVVVEEGSVRTIRSWSKVSLTLKGRSPVWVR